MTNHLFKSVFFTVLLYLALPAYSQHQLEVEGNTHIQGNETISGNVGIGVTNPTSKLHISSINNTGDIKLDDSYPFLTLNATDPNGNSGISFMESGEQTGYIIHRSDSDAILISGNNGSSQPNLAVSHTGRVGIGTATPSYPFHMTKDTMSINGLELANLGSSNLGLDGDIVPYAGSIQGYDLGNNISTQHWDDVVAVDFITYSDARLKTGITNIKAGLSEILSLHPVAYQYIREVTPDDRLRFGLIAQEAESVLPNVVINEDVDVDPETGTVVKTPSEFKAINYMDLVPVLIHAIQEQQAYIKSLENRIEKLEKQR